MEQYQHFDKLIYRSVLPWGQLKCHPGASLALSLITLCSLKNGIFSHEVWRQVLYVWVVHACSVAISVRPSV